ncbi:MAG: NnrS family protein [Candidatus Omnitrophica bacterium]|nr:NnrS family protein [Candidatus Omnitrophota bacterium]
MLTLGAVWGAWLLLRIGFLKTFSSVGYHEVNAHGHAQIFGWVGLFVMGFAYQAFPRFKHTSLAYPKLAYATLGLMITGILLRSGLEPFANAYGLLRFPTIFGTGLEIVAIILFGWIILATWKRSLQPIAFYDYYILSAMVWFVIQAIYELALLVGTLSASTPERELSLIATYQAPLREIQIYGFAMLMIFGVGQRIFPRFYGLPDPTPQKSLIILGMINFSIMVQSTAFILMQKASHAWAGLWYLSSVGLVLSITLLIWDLNPFAKAAEGDRSLKFIRIAFGWLLISLSMLTLLPVYQFFLLPALSPGSNSVQIGFSHAFYGAIRHAVTVGFISMMIVGVSAKVVPTLNGIDPRSLSGLWAPFFLINVGCALRVSFQTLTDITDTAFPIAGISGIFEVTGLGLWGFHLFGLMRTRQENSEPSSTQVKGYRPLRENGSFEGGNVVAEVLDAYPHLLTQFVDSGFTPLRNPLVRKTMGRITTLEMACRRIGLDQEAFLQALTEARDKCDGDHTPTSIHSNDWQGEPDIDKTQGEPRSRGMNTNADPNASVQSAPPEFHSNGIG